MLVSTKHLAHFLCSSIFVFPGHPLALTYVGQIVCSVSLVPKPIMQQTVQLPLGVRFAIFLSGMEIASIMVKVKVSQSRPTLQPHGFYSPWNSPEYLIGQPFPFPGDLPNPGIKPRSPTLQVDSSSAEPQGNTGVGSLSLFQGIFPTQESNRGLLHCRWILDQLSYQGMFPEIGKLQYQMWMGRSQSSERTEKTARELMCVFLFYCIE